MDMKCKKDNCNGVLEFESDFDFEDYGIEGEGIISTWKCPKCGQMHELVSDYELGEEYLQLEGEPIC